MRLVIRFDPVTNLAWHYGTLQSRWTINPLQAANELQRTGGEAFALEDIDFGRRVALEKEVAAYIGGAPCYLMSREFQAGCGISCLAGHGLWEFWPSNRIFVGGAPCYGAFGGAPCSPLSRRPSLVYGLVQPCFNCCLNSCCLDPWLQSPLTLLLQPHSPFLLQPL
jgi:hypothetical protein